MKLGKYRHYKGNNYDVLGIARQSGDNPNEEFVVYRALYYDREFGKNALWFRPKREFLQKINFKGKKVPRFKYIGKSK